MDLDMEFIKVLGGLKCEPKEIKKEIKMDPDPVEIGIDDILDSSDEEIDTKDERNTLLLDNKETIDKYIKHVSPNHSEKGSTAEILDKTQAMADSNASENLQSDEIFVLNFGKIPAKPKEVDWSEVYSSNRTTDCSKELKEVIVTRPPKECTVVAPHEYTRLSKTHNVCNHCQHTTNNIQRLRKHIRQHHRTVTKMHQCPYCSFKSKWSLKNHIIFKHIDDNDIQWFKCHLCSLKFKAKIRLSHHMLGHLHTEQMLGDLHTCNICKKSFKRKDQRQRHIKLIHNKDKLEKIPCQECDYVTTQKCNLKEHIKRIHSDLSAETIYKCDKCEFKTRRSVSLYQHNATNHKTEFICELCGYKASTKDRMRLHHLTHKNELSEKDLKYQCNRCDYKTYRLFSFKVHKLNHLKPEEIEYFYCYHCDFKAKRKDNLKTHVLRHFKKEEVKLQCYLCKFSSKKRSLLTTHIKEQHSKVAHV